MKVYYCKKCKFLFRCVNEPTTCPDCGSSMVGEATNEQKAEFAYQQELSKSEQW
ncbi:hypothetical protein [Anaerotignum sp.]|uniref:hypothetical protein n=1 Tax=Anaerotignum sp. TaxID=2039241 RepID=UPI0028AB5C85|nr:hypothetical protein [Anaerotignum sp.]